MRTHVLDPPRRGADVRTLFGLFSSLLAISLVLDQLWWGGFELRSPHAVVVLTALWVLLRPTSVGRFTAMVAADVVAVALDLPEVGSHRLLAMICGACVLGHIGWTTLRTRRLPEPGAVFAAIAPFLRAAMIVLYAFAALAKLNTDYVVPATSCVTPVSRQLTWFDPSLLTGPGRPEIAIGASVLTEAALAVLLAVPRTRPFALLAGLGFHTVLGLTGNVPFTALAFAFYVAFLPPDTPGRIRALVGEHPDLRRWIDRAGRVRGAGVPLLALLVLTWLAGAARGPSESAPGLTGTPSALVSTSIGDGTRLAVVVLAVAGVLLLLARWAAPAPEDPAADDGRAPRAVHPILVGGILLLVLNGLCPYLGLKTDTSFEMFSNLRTEPGYWNHLVVPEAVRVFGYQDQPVRIVSSNDPRLVARTTGDTRLVRFELDRYLRAHPGTVATYTIATPRGEQAARPIGPLPAGPTVTERIATFRDVPPAGRSRC